MKNFSSRDLDLSVVRMPEFNNEKTAFKYHDISSESLFLTRIKEIKKISPEDLTKINRGEIIGKGKFGEVKKINIKEKAFAVKTLIGEEGIDEYMVNNFLRESRVYFLGTEKEEQDTKKKYKINGIYLFFEMMEVNEYIVLLWTIVLVMIYRLIYIG